MDTLTHARQLGGDLVELRRALHREPEIGLDLPRTRDRVLRALDGLPLEITLGRDCTSVTAVLRGGAGGAGATGAAGTSASGAGAEASAPRAVLLRADMDALPVQERTGAEYSSRTEGVMHACGHDLHTSMLVGAARLLCDERERLAGDVVFMFQPGEEGYDGAGVMIAEGVLEAADRTVDHAYGMHVFSSLEPHGRFTTRPGTMMAAADALRVSVTGAGGHGSAPHLAADPVGATAEMVTALQLMVTRRFDIFDPVVLSVGVLRAGTKRNIIPDTASFEATVRTFSRASRAAMRVETARLIHGIASAHGLEAEVEYIEEFGPTVNTEGEAEHAREVIAGVFGEDRAGLLAQPFGASEDFSRVLDRVPGAFIGLGACPPGVDPASAPFNHSPYADFHDGVLADGAAVYAALARSRL